MSWPSGKGRRLLAAGAVAVIAYVVVAAATVAVSARHVRPLFEGVGPPPAYQWVKPPAQFATGNVTPHAQTVSLALTAAGTPEAGPSSSDAQLILNLPKGAIVAHGSDTSVQVKITPLDPAGVSPVPAGERAAGNAYRVEMTYEPSSTPVARMAVAGNVIMVTPFDGVTILYAPDDKSPWQPQATQPLSGNTTLGSTISAPGVFLAVAKGVTTSTTVPAGKGGGGGGTVALAAIIGILVVGLVVAGVLTRRRRRARTAGGGSAGGRGGRPAAKAPAKSTGKRRPGPRSRPR